MPKLAEQAEQKNVSQENAETAVNVESAASVEKEETAEQEKKEAAKDPLKTTSAGGATTTVTGLPHVLKEETEVGAVKETATAKRAAALNVEAEVTSNVIVEAVPSAVVGVPDLTKSPEAENVEAEEMSEEVEGGLTVTAAVLKIATVAETAETEEADLTHPTAATAEQEDMKEEAAHLRDVVKTAEEMIEDTIVSVELVGLHPRNHIHHQDLILTLVRLASDHPPGPTAKRKANVKDDPATATMKCIHLEIDHAAKAEDANAAAPRNPTTKETTLRRSTSSSQNSLQEKNLQKLIPRTTKIAPAIERVPRSTAHQHAETLQSEGLLLG